MKYERVINKNDKDYFLDEIVKDKNGETKGAVYKTKKGVREYFTDWELGIGVKVVYEKVPYSIDTYRHRNSRLTRDLRNDELWI